MADMTVIMSFECMHQGKMSLQNLQLCKPWKPGSTDQSRSSDLREISGH